MFHQHADGSCQGFDHTGSHAWGHGRSPDLVRWTRMNNSGVCGSTSGGITVLPADLPPTHPGDCSINQFGQHFQYCTVFVWKNKHVKRDYLI